MEPLITDIYMYTVITNLLKAITVVSAFPNSVQTTVDWEISVWNKFRKINFRKFNFRKLSELTKSL